MFDQRSADAAATDEALDRHLDPLDALLIAARVLEVEIGQVGAELHPARLLEGAQVLHRIAVGQRDDALHRLLLLAADNPQERERVDVLEQEVASKQAGKVIPRVARLDDIDRFADLELVGLLHKRRDHDRLLEVGLGDRLDLVGKVVPEIRGEFLRVEQRQLLLSLLPPEGGDLLLHLGRNDLRLGDGLLGGSHLGRCLQLLDVVAHILELELARQLPTALSQSPQDLVGSVLAIRDPVSLVAGEVVLGCWRPDVGDLGVQRYLFQADALVVAEQLLGIRRLQVGVRPVGVDCSLLLDGDVDLLALEQLVRRLQIDSGLEHRSLELLLLGAGLEVDVRALGLDGVIGEVPGDVLEVLEGEDRHVLAGRAQQREVDAGGDVLEIELREQDELGHRRVVDVDIERLRRNQDRRHRSRHSIEHG